MTDGGGRGFHRCSSPAWITSAEATDEGEHMSPQNFPAGFIRLEQCTTKLVENEPFALKERCVVNHNKFSKTDWITLIIASPFNNKRCAAWWESGVFSSPITRSLWAQLILSASEKIHYPESFKASAFEPWSHEGWENPFDIAEKLWGALECTVFTKILELHQLCNTGLWSVTGSPLGFTSRPLRLYHISMLFLQ